MAIQNHAPIVKVEMRIRKPVAEVFEAFIDPLEHGFVLNLVADKASYANVKY